MPNFLEMMRLKNLFGQGQMGNSMPPPNAIPNADFQQGFAGQNPYNNVSFGSTRLPIPQPQVQNQNPDDFDPVARMAQLYTPEHAASDRYNSMVNAFPVEQEASKKRKFGGAILGSLTDLGTNFGGNKTNIKGSDVYDETTGKNKYREAVGKWKEQIGPAGTAATLERTNNANERLTASQTVNAELVNRRDDNRNRTNETNTKIREDRAAVYRYKAEHPDKKFDFSGPHVLIGDPATGQIDTGISTGSLSDADKLNLEHKNKTEEIHTTGQEARKTEETRQTGRIATVDERGDQTRKTNLEKPASNRNESPSQTKIRQYTTAKTFAAMNPDLGKFIKFNKANEFTIMPPVQKSGGIADFFRGVGPTKEQHDAITKAVFGDALPVMQPQRTGAGGTPSSKFDESVAKVIGANPNPAGVGTGSPRSSNPRIGLPGSGVPSQPQQSIPGLPPTGKIKVSNDGGKTKYWLPFEEFEAAQKQGFSQVQ